MKIKKEQERKNDRLITSSFQASRWSLVCSICRVKEGACIQCAVKTCKTAFHVTCAFSNNLDMKTILDENEDDVQLKVRVRARIWSCQKI